MDTHSHSSGAIKRDRQALTTRHKFSVNKNGQVSIYDAGASLQVHYIYNGMWDIPRSLSRHTPFVLRPSSMQPSGTGTAATARHLVYTEVMPIAYYSIQALMDAPEVMVSVLDVVSLGLSVLHALYSWHHHGQFCHGRFSAECVLLVCTSKGHADPPFGARVAWAPEFQKQAIPSVCADLKGLANLLLDCLDPNKCSRPYDLHRPTTDLWTLARDLSCTGVDGRALCHGAVFSKLLKLQEDLLQLNAETRWIELFNVGNRFSEEELEALKPCSAISGTLKTPGSPDEQHVHKVKGSMAAGPGGSAASTIQLECCYPAHNKQKKHGEESGPAGTGAAGATESMNFGASACVRSSLAAADATGCGMIDGGRPQRQQEHPYGSAAPVAPEQRGGAERQGESALVGSSENVSGGWSAVPHPALANTPAVYPVDPTHGPTTREGPPHLEVTAYWFKILQVLAKFMCLVSLFISGSSSSRSWMGWKWPEGLTRQDYEGLEVVPAPSFRALDESIRHFACEAGVKIEMDLLALKDFQQVIGAQRWSPRHTQLRFEYVLSVAAAVAISTRIHSIVLHLFTLRLCVATSAEEILAVLDELCSSSPLMKSYLPTDAVTPTPIATQRFDDKTSPAEDPCPFFFGIPLHDIRHRLATASPSGSTHTLLPSALASLTQCATAVACRLQHILPQEWPPPLRAVLLGPPAAQHLNQFSQQQTLLTYLQHVQECVRQLPQDVHFQKILETMQEKALAGKHSERMPNFSVPYAAWHDEPEAILLTLFEAHRRQPLRLDNVHAIVHTLVRDIRTGRELNGCPDLGVPYSSVGDETGGLGWFVPVQLPASGRITSHLAAQMASGAHASEAFEPVMIKQYAAPSLPMLPIHVLEALQSYSKPSRAALSKMTVLEVDVTQAGQVLPNIVIMFNVMLILSRVGMMARHCPFVHSPIAQVAVSAAASAQRLRLLLTPLHRLTLEDLLLPDSGVELQELDVIELCMELFAAVHTARTAASFAHGHLTADRVGFSPLDAEGSSSLGSEPSPLGTSRVQAQVTWAFDQPGQLTASLLRVHTEEGMRSAVANDVSNLAAILNRCLKRWVLARPAGDLDVWAPLRLSIASMTTSDQPSDASLALTMLCTWECLVHAEKTACWLGPKVARHSVAAQFMSMMSGAWCSVPSIPPWAVIGGPAWQCRSGCPHSHRAQALHATVQGAAKLGIKLTFADVTSPEEVGDSGRLRFIAEASTEPREAPPGSVWRVPRGCVLQYDRHRVCLVESTIEATGEGAPPRLIFSADAQFELTDVMLVGCELAVCGKAEVVAKRLRVVGSRNQKRGIVVSECGQLNMDEGSVEDCVQPLLVGDVVGTGMGGADGRATDGVTIAGKDVTADFENSAIFDTIMRVEDNAHSTLDTVASIIHADDMVGLTAADGASFEVRRSQLHMCCTTVLVGDRGEVTVRDSLLTSARKHGREQDDRVTRSDLMKDVGGFQDAMDQVMQCFAEKRAVVAKAPPAAAGQLAMLAQYITEHTKKSVLVRVGQFMSEMNLLIQLWQKLPSWTEMPFTSEASVQEAQDYLVERLQSDDLLLVFDCSFGLGQGVVQLASRLAGACRGNKMLLMLPDDAMLVDEFTKDAGENQRLWHIRDKVHLPAVQRASEAGTRLVSKPSPGPAQAARATVRGVRISSRPSKRVWDEEKFYSATDCMPGGLLQLYGSTLVAHHGDGANIMGTLDAKSTSIQATDHRNGWVHDNICITGGGAGKLSDCRLVGGGAGLRVEDENSKAALKDCTVSHNDSAGVIVQKQGTLDLVDCVVSDTKQFQGLHVRHRGSSVKCVGCVFDGNRDAGVYLQQGARVILVGCKLSNSQSSQGACAHGEVDAAQGDAPRVPIQGATYLEARSCHFIGNCETGVWIRRGAYARFEECVFAESRNCQGVQARDSGTLVELIKCNIRDVYDAGIWLHNGATVRLSQTSVQGSRSSQGIQAHDMHTTLECKDSFIFYNHFAGVLVRNCARALLQHCTVSATQDGPGVHAKGRLARVQLNGTVVTAHKGPGIWLQYNAAARVRGCTVEGCDEHGMVIENPRSAAVVVNSTFSGNTKSCVFMKAGAVAWFRSCSMLSSKKFYGMSLVGHTESEEQEGQPAPQSLPQTEARVDNCDFEGSSQGGALMREGARGAFNACSFVQPGENSFIALSGSTGVMNNCILVHKEQDGVLSYDSDLLLSKCRQTFKDELTPGRGWALGRGWPDEPVEAVPGEEQEHDERDSAGASGWAKQGQRSGSAMLGRKSGWTKHGEGLISAGAGQVEADRQGDRQYLNYMTQSQSRKAELEIPLDHGHFPSVAAAGNSARGAGPEEQANV